MIIIISGTCFAQDVYSNLSTAPDASQMASRFSNGIGIGIGTANGQTSSVGRWNPDFSFGNLSVGLDINFAVGEKKDPNIETIVIRNIGYNTSSWGIKYGLLSGVTFGQGLLISNYSTITKGGIIQSNKQTGLRGYYKFGIYGVDALYTWSNLYVLRVTEDLYYQLPITLGQYYITDSDGVNFKKTDGTSQNYSSPSGIGVDAQVPLIWGTYAFAEYAKLLNHGGGFTAGLSAGYDFGVAKTNFRAERRFIEYNFIPGYFNENYETNPINITSYEANSSSKDGYKVALNTEVLSKGYATAVLEGYNGSNSALKADAYADITQDYFASASFYQPNFKDARSLDLQQGAIITGKMGYKLNQFTNVIANYKKAYDPDLGKIVETQWYEMKFVF